MSGEVLLVVALLVTALVTVSYFLFKKYVTEERVMVTAHAIIPDFLERSIDPIILKAYQAVEQRVRAYGEMTMDARLELAKKYAQAIYDYYESGKLTPDAIEAFIESLIYGEHQTVVLSGPIYPTDKSEAIK